MNDTQKYIELNQKKKLKKSLDKLALSIKRASYSAENEATIASSFEISVFSFIDKEFDKKVFPIKEKSLNTERRISKGRIDSKYGAFIIEFKHRSKLRTKNHKSIAVKQLTDYLNSYKKTGQNYLGLVTDGLISKFIRLEDGKLQMESWKSLSGKVLDRITRAVLSLEQVSLTPENLIRDFCEPYDSSVYQRIGKEFYFALTKYPTGKTLMLYEEWKELFKLAHDDKTKQRTIEERRKGLEEALTLKIKNNEDEYKMLYALQTTYALIIKLIAFKVVSNIHFDSKFIKFNELASYDSKTVQMQLSALEDGAIFNQAGILNLLEGDFFSWYSSRGQWNEKFHKLIKEILEILSKYEDKILLKEYSETKDLFKKLYEIIIPSKVRHSLGEFYTPPWLADSVIAEAMQLLAKKTDWKALDPCAGSGTFITNLIQRILSEDKEFNSEEKLKDILKRVKAIDLNPLAVLTTRVNYFVSISHLIDTKSTFQIPVYLGDASYVPEKIMVDKILCFKYQIKTLKGYIDVILPKSVVSDSEKFSKIMSSIETDIKTGDEKLITNKIMALASKKDLTIDTKRNINLLAKKFIELEKNEWNGIWARIVTNFLTTANLGDFDVVVGNPPWIDWKNLPEGYRDRIKGLCVDRHLFSGDRITGGINLNICALIANVSADNWLSNNGILAFLMPENLIFQQTYEGFRQFLVGGKQKRLYLQKLTDWTKSGHPFKPVQYKFLSYFFSKNKVNYFKGIKVDRYKKKKGFNIEKINESENFQKASIFYDKENLLAGTTSKTNSSMSYAKSEEDLRKFSMIAGECYYIGREGIEFYPQEVFLLMPQLHLKAPEGLMYVKNFQNPRSKYKVPEETILLEKKFLYPLVKGVDIKKYHLDAKNQFVVPFPYAKNDTRLPLPLKKLRKQAPLLTKYLLRHKQILESQTEYNEKIIGKKNQEFYALARVGKYSFHNIHVAYRDNTKWLSTVVGDIKIDWGKFKRALFQNHAPTICEGGNGEFISLDEAFFISGILNTPIVIKFIMDSSDSRTFKVRPPVYIPKYDSKNKAHKQISSLSQAIHQSWGNKIMVQRIENRLEELYLNVASHNSNYPT